MEDDWLVDKMLDALNFLSYFPLRGLGLVFLESIR